MFKIMLSNQSLGALESFAGKTTVPSKRRVFSPCQFKELPSPFTLGCVRPRLLALRINWKRLGLLSKTGRTKRPDEKHDRKD
jgi:hypothetical protein